jgi:hypothetical protein
MTSCWSCILSPSWLLCKTLPNFNDAFFLPSESPFFLMINGWHPFLILLPTHWWPFIDGAWWPVHPLLTCALDKYIWCFLYMHIVSCLLEYIFIAWNFISLVVTPAFPKKTKCIPICMPGSSFMHIVTYKWIQKQYHERKTEIIRDLRFILETKAPNITGNQLGVAYA